MTNAESWTISKVFHRANKHDFEIPKYQRGYSWKPEQIVDFLEDLKKTDKNEDYHHFFGTVYTTKDGKKNIIKIVDGQQRITTCALFLICARDHMFARSTPGSDTKNLDRIQEVLYKTDYNKQEPDTEKFLLRLSRTNQSFFSNKITPCKKFDEKKDLEKEAYNDSNENLAITYNHFSELFAKKDILEINRLCWTLLDKFELVNITVDNDVEAYKMFNLINNRGIGLAKFDLIKNILFGKLDAEFHSDVDSEFLLDKYDQKWADLRDMITGQNSADYDLDNFCNHYLVVFASEDSDVKHKNTFTKLKNTFVEIEEAIETKKFEPKELLDALLSLSEIFVKIRNPKQFPKQESNTRYYLRKIRNIKAIYVYPVLLAGYKEYWENQDKKSFAKLTEVCFKYHLRTKTAGIGITLEKYQNKLYGIARKIKTEKFTINQVIEELIKDEDSYPSDDKIKLQLRTLKVTNANSAIAFLEEIEKTLDENKISDSNITIEHIMPKNISNWREYIIEKHDYPGESSDNDAKLMHTKYLNWLGNQTLLSGPKNIKNSNKPFHEKKKIYEHAGYKITEELHNETDWTIDTITNRQNKLAEKLLEILNLKNCYI